MDFSLTPEQELIRDSAREFCEREIVPHSRNWDRAEELDPALVPKLADAGYLGATIAEEYGGMGLDTVSYCLLMEELGRADSSVRGIVSVNLGLVGKTIARWGTDEQRSAWLPQLASGTSLGCYALTEPGSGSDPASLVARAERDGEDWLLSGSKLFITLGSWAGLALVFARSGGEGARGLTCFLVPTDSTGYLKNNANPKYANDPIVTRYQSLLATYGPSGADPKNTFYFYGFAKAYDVVKLLYNAGKNPTRASLIKATQSMNWVNPYMIKGIRVKTSKTDHFPISQLKLLRYENGTFTEFGSLIKGR